MVLPKAIAAAFFAPWAFIITVNSLPEPLRLRVQKSPLIQQGKKMPTVTLQPPRVSRRRLSPAIVEVTRSFKKEYPAKDVELLWGALVKCYGSQDRAIRAARANPQIVNPSYSFCNTMLESKSALVTVMSEKEALEVMDNNPAVLQCGPSLAALGSTEIKTVANFIKLRNQLPEEVRNVLLGSFVAIALFPVLVAQNPELADSSVLQTAESAAGAVVAPVFAGAILYFLKSAGS